MTIPSTLKACLIASTLILAGCSSYMHGYTSDAARGNHLKVDEATRSFGYKRITYIIGFRGEGIKAFIEEKGMPGYLYEFKQGKREGFIFYYLKERQAYVFVEESWRPDSARLVETRSLNENELRRFGLSAD
jgi:hypothetical protein